MKKSVVAICLLSTMFLAGCVTQQQADVKMGKGCEAGITAMIAPKTLMAIKSTNYSDEKTEGSLYRRVTVVAVEKDGWLELEKTYSCLFAQQWGLFKSSHGAMLEQLVIGDQVLGKQDGKIIGSMDDFLKLTSEAETAMGQ